jgi:hypothetical protein
LRGGVVATVTNHSYRKLFVYLEYAEPKQHVRIANVGGVRKDNEKTAMQKR